MRSAVCVIPAKRDSQSHHITSHQPTQTFAMNKMFLVQAYRGRLMSIRRHRDSTFGSDFAKASFPVCCPSRRSHHRTGFALRFEQCGRPLPSLCRRHVRAIRGCEAKEMPCAMGVRDCGAAPRRPQRRPSSTPASIGNDDRNVWVGDGRVLIWVRRMRHVVDMARISIVNHATQRGYRSECL